MHLLLEKIRWVDRNLHMIRTRTWSQMIFRTNCYYSLKLCQILIKLQPLLHCLLTRPTVFNTNWVVQVQVKAYLPQSTNSWAWLQTILSARSIVQLPFPLPMWFRGHSAATTALFEYPVKGPALDNSAMLLIHQHLKSSRLHTLPRFWQIDLFQASRKVDSYPRKKKTKIELEGKFTTESRVASLQEFNTIHRAKNQKTLESSAKKSYPFSCCEDLWQQNNRNSNPTIFRNVSFLFLFYSSSFLWKSNLL